MKRHRELPLHAGYTPVGFQDHGYATAPATGSSRRPATQGSGGVRHLPSIFDNRTGFILPMSVDNGLTLDIKAMPTTGLLVPPTIPRLAHNVEKKRLSLSSSDTTSDRIRQASRGYSPSYSVASGVHSGKKRTNSQPAVVPILSAARRVSGDNLTVAEYESLHHRSSLHVQPPALGDSKYRMYGVLPPIGAQGGVGGGEEEEEGDESTVDSFAISNSEDEDSDDVS